MHDYLMTVFNLIVGLLNSDKLIILAVIGLGIVVAWQLLGLLFSFHASLARKCRRISKFLTVNGLSADNYNAFLALLAKMPQEFIRGYKTFEHASYGLPSDYIKRFESIDVETNGGMFNKGKSIIKSFIYAFTLFLALIGLALVGDNPLTGASLAQAFLLPVLFLILAKGIYYIFIAIRQQQYRVAVDEFNEMLDIMNDKIENNDNLPGPDVLALATEEELASKADDYYAKVVELQADNHPVYAKKVDETKVYNEPKIEVKQPEPTTEVFEDSLAEETIKEVPAKIVENNNDVVENKPKKSVSKKDKTEKEVQVVTEEKSEIVAEPVKKQRNHKPKQQKKVKLTKKEDEDLENEQKRGRGRPKKIPEGELVITNDKQFEEVLGRAEKLMRKSEEALSASQAKRVEKSLKELVDAMTKYKESLK